MTSASRLIVLSDSEEDVCEGTAQQVTASSPLAPIPQPALHPPVSDDEIDSEPTENTDLGAYGEDDDHEEEEEDEETEEVVPDTLEAVEVIVTEGPVETPAAGESETPAPVAAVTPSAPVGEDTLEPAPKRRRVDFRRWDWIVDLLSRWRDQEGIPSTFETGESSKGGRLHPLVSEPIERTVPTLVARCARHEADLGKLLDGMGTLGRKRRWDGHVIGHLQERMSDMERRVRESVESSSGIRDMRARMNALERDLRRMEELGDRTLRTLDGIHTDGDTHQREITDLTRRFTELDSEMTTVRGEMVETQERAATAEERAETAMTLAMACLMIVTAIMQARALDRSAS